MLEALGIILFALLILASIALHEVGHMVPAKKFGVKVSEYMVGFGPTIWSKVKGDTRYGIKAFPVGGYIRMIGMLPPAKNDPDGKPRSMSTGRFAVMIADARKQSLEDVGPGDENRVFYKLPPWKRIIIMLGGPVMNLVLATVLFTILLVGIGTTQPSLTVQQLVPCTPTVEQPTGQALPSGQCPTGTQVSPAIAAGLQTGDTIVSFNNQPAESWDQVTSAIRASAGQTVTLGVERNGSEFTIPVDVTAVTRPVYNEVGEETGETQTAGFLGVRPDVEYVRQPITAVPGAMWELTTRSVEALISLPVRLVELVTDTLIGGGERSLESPVSVVGVSRIGGDVVASDESIQSKAAMFLGLAASLNLFLFLFNLLPILPLDGGHVIGAVYESIKRRLARWFGKPDPGPVDVARALPLAYVVAAVLLGVGVIVIWADIVKPISLG